MRIIFFIGFLFLGTLLSNAQKNTYKDKTKSVEFRVNDLLKRMTLDEKIAQMRHIHQGHFDSSGVMSLNKLKNFAKDNSYGAFEAFGFTAENYLKAVNTVNNYMKNNTRLGIPVLPVQEGLHGVVQDGCTIFPQAIAMASTFDPELIYEMAKVIAKEMKAIGAKQNFSPVLDLAREQRWGRVEETYGEDPFLVSKMGVSYVKGIRSENLVCTPKHFIAHGSPQSGLNLASVEGGKNTLMNIYLQPFKKVFKEANPLSVMNCYSSYEGEVIAGSKYYLTNLLRDALGFKGYVYSDWGSVSMLNYFHRVAQNDMEAAYQSVIAGMDMEASSDAYRFLKYMVEKKILDVKYIDRAVENILYVKFACGLFDEEVAGVEDFKTKIHTPEAIKITKRLADESIILMKNDNNFLPLDKNKIKSVAVIGPNADMVQVGDYSRSRGNTDGISPLKGIKEFVANTVKVNYAMGCDWTARDSSKFNEAKDAAKISDVAVVFVGSQSASLGRNYENSTSGEGFDLTSLKLPGVQEELLRAVASTGTPTILVLVTGKPFEVNWAKEKLPAIITQFYGGEEQGSAIAGVLFGKVNPSQKLPITFAKEVGQLPVFYNYYPSDKGFYNKKGSPDKPGRDYVFSDPYPAYVFGYGLSYTNFKIDNVKFSKEQLKADDVLNVTLDITNTGNYDGKEVVQLYVRDLFSSIVRLVKELKAFEKVFVPKGQKKTITLSLQIKELELYNAQNKWVVEPGDYEIQIGASSADIVFKKNIILAGENADVFAKQPSAEEMQKDIPIGRELTVSGVIRDVQSTRVGGVMVSVNGKNISTTKEDGSYRIKARVGEKLVFSKQGYRTTEKIVTEDGIVNVNIDVL